MKSLIKLCDQMDALREKRSLRNKNYENPAYGALLESLRNMPEDRFHGLAAMGVELARQDAEQNLRVRKEQLQKANKAETGNARMHFFLMEGFTPALEPKPGSMLLLIDDGSWVPISPREVLADDRSSEVSEHKFCELVEALDCRMPDNPALVQGSPTIPSQSATKGAESLSLVATSIYQKAGEKPFSLMAEEEQRIKAQFAKG